MSYNHNIPYVRVERAVAPSTKGPNLRNARNLVFPLGLVDLDCLGGSCSYCLATMLRIDTSVWSCVYTPAPQVVSLLDDAQAGMMLRQVPFCLRNEGSHSCVPFDSIDASVPLRVQGQFWGSGSARLAFWV